MKEKTLEGGNKSKTTERCADRRRCCKTSTRTASIFETCAFWSSSWPHSMTITGGRFVMAESRTSQIRSSAARSNVDSVFSMTSSPVQKKQTAGETKTFFNSGCYCTRIEVTFWIMARKSYLYFRAGKKRKRLARGYIHAKIAW